MKKYSSKKTFALLFIWVLVGTAVGIYLINSLTKSKDDETPAPLAQARQCGPTDLSSSEEDKILSEWTVKVEKLPADAKKALAANIKVMPEDALMALKKYNLKITFDRGESPYICQTFDGSSGKSTNGGRPRQSAENCLKITSKNSLALVIGHPRLEMPDGQRRVLSEKELVDELTTPSLFWAIFDGLYKPTDDPTKNLGPNDRSIQNISENIKRYIVGAYKFSTAEQEHYLRRFGAAGTETPAFMTRTLVLTASNLYCSKESFDRLSKSQPEATQRFMSIYGCTLGKPWHLADGEFSKFCSSVAVAK
jgi:hypothetical protein